MLEEEKQRKVSIQDNWGKTLSVAVEGFVRRNPQMLNGIPLIGQELAGVIEQDNKRLEQDAANGGNNETHEPQVSFRKVSEEEMNSKNLFTEDEKKILAYHKNLQTVFTPMELATITQIIVLFSQEKENIHVVYDMLTEENEESSSEESTLKGAI